MIYSIFTGNNFDVKHQILSLIYTLKCVLCEKKRTAHTHTHSIYFYTDTSLFMSEKRNMHACMHALIKSSKLWLKNMNINTWEKKSLNHHLIAKVFLMSCCCSFFVLKIRLNFCHELCVFECVCFMKYGRELYFF